MTITEIARRVRADKTCCYIRLRSGGKGEPKQYDMREAFGGNRRGWTLLDLMTASAILTVHDGVSDDWRSKMDTMPLRTLVDFCWRAVA